MNISERKQHQEFIDNLKVGDKVAIKRVSRYGWGMETTVHYNYDTIKRITPKRTKFDFQKGRCLERDEINSIYPITEETDRINEIFQKRTTLFDAISSITSNATSATHKKLDARNFAEGDLDRAIEIVGELATMLEIGRADNVHGRHAR